MAHKNVQQSKKGKPRSAGSRKNKIAAYYEFTYPERKLRHMVNAGCSIARLRGWADAFRTPSGGSGNGALVRIAKRYNLNISQQ